MLLNIIADKPLLHSLIGIYQSVAFKTANTNHSLGVKDDFKK